MHQFRDWFAIIDITRSEQDIQQFASIVDHQVQFETEKPAGGGLASFSQSSKYFVRSNPLIEADIQRKSNR